MDKISVVIPVYNVEQFLEKCLRSICNQTFENLEILCVDDGSTDKSPDVLKRYSEIDERIKVYSKTNGGAPSAWQYGIERAAGDYLIFLDADDHIEPTMYEKLYSSIIENKADMSVAGYYKDYSDHIEPQSNKWTINRICENVEELFRYAFIRDQYRNFGAFIWNKLVRMDVVRDNDISFDETIARGADVLFFSEVAAKVKRMVYIDECLYHYTQWNMSLTKARSYEKGIGILKAYSGVIDKGNILCFSDETINYIKRFYAYHAGQMMEWALSMSDADIIQKCRGYLMKYYDEYLHMNIDDDGRVNWMKELVKKSVL